MMERNITIDYFKLFLCVLVMTIHMSPLFTADKANLGGWLISNGISRIAVPCFFLLNGYFIAERIRDCKFVKTYLIRLIILYIVWTAIYYVRFSHYDTTYIPVFLIAGYYHLWYITALIGGVLLLYFLRKWVNNNQVLLIGSIVLILCGYYIQNHIYPFAYAAINVILYKNAIFIGLPFIFGGYYIRSIEAKIKNIKLYGLLFPVILSFITLLVEAGNTDRSSIPNDLYVSLIVFCPTLFILVLKYSKYAPSDGYIGKLASGIYFVHILMFILVRTILNYPREDHIYILPITLFFSMIASAGIIELNKRLKIFL
ncbi:acyltransferase [Viscerimonas tarda]